jgi:hypothetical protein
MYISFFGFLDSKLEDKNSAVNDSIHCLSSVCPEVLHEWNFDLLGLFHTFELFYNFKGFSPHPYVVILSCMLFMRHEHILSFSEFTSR